MKNQGIDFKTNDTIIMDKMRESSTICHNEECKKAIREEHKAMENPPEECYQNTSTLTKQLMWCFCNVHLVKIAEYEIPPGAVMITYKCPECGIEKDITYAKTTTETA
jgi:hypothetical protein